jgi:DNA-binding NarL/FixJ family response regulator
MTPRTIRVLIADDHAIVREGLKQIIKLQSAIECAAEASCGEQVLRLLREQDFDLLLLDMTMQGLSGVELIRQVRSLRPALPILILSMHDVAQLALHAIKAGANGYITKGSEPEKIFDAIGRVARGGRYIDPHLSEELTFESAAERPDAPHTLLSLREFEVFRLLAAGHGNQEIAHLLAISEKTVSTYKTRILDKMGMRGVAELVRYAVERDLFR